MGGGRALLHVDDGALDLVACTDAHDVSHIVVPCAVAPRRRNFDRDENAGPSSAAETLRLRRDRGHHSGTCDGIKNTVGSLIAWRLASRPARATPVCRRPAIAPALVPFVASPASPAPSQA